MKDYIEKDAWCIIEKNFHPEYQRMSESLFSLGNGRMGQRGNFEEQYSGDSMQGNYVAGIYYPDKTRVGWWKNGYPEYFAKVLNAPNWIGIDVFVEDEALDLAKCKVANFTRILNMRKGYLKRSFIAKMSSGIDLKVHTKRFLSIVDDDCGVIRFSITPLNADARITLVPYIDADVKNEDANYDEKFWDVVEKKAHEKEAYITARTKKLDFHVCCGMMYEVYRNGMRSDFVSEGSMKEKYVAGKTSLDVRQGERIDMLKYTAVLSSINHQKDSLPDHAREALENITAKGFDKMLEEQIAAWKKKWERSDIVIKGDIAAQQGIRFNIFQLNQTYTGEDERLNIGPKGFTGEKYGGSTYWDTEAYCLPFYLSSAPEEVARKLLLYRYRHLQKAIENAEKLGFKNGAALYPMVTMNGEECHNEWEITFEEIHRNGAIAYAIYDYIRYTGDWEYLTDYGLEVLIAISRFWSQRVNFSEAKQQFVMLGVTGPNEYENNVNNNWYTSRIACWTMRYTIEAIEFVKNEHPEKLSSLMAKTNFDESVETDYWKEIVENMFFPEDDKKGIFLQQEAFLDKVIKAVTAIPREELPINQHWSWDRILRSCYIKQADVLQGLYFFEDEFKEEVIRRNYDFYEPLTVHESSLSPCIHAILAAKLSYEEKAYDLYLRTARLDLDDYNNDTEDGCHITSMAGTWMSVVYGFGGMRVKKDVLNFNPFIPVQWESYDFKILFREKLIRINVDRKNVMISNFSEQTISIFVFGDEYKIEAQGKLSLKMSRS